MTPEKDIKKVITQMTGVTEQQIVQRMHDFNASIEARSAANRPPEITEGQPPSVQSRIEVTEQKLEARPFVQTARDTGSTSAQTGASGVTGSTIPMLDMNEGGTFVRYTLVLYSGTRTPI
jgi:hypothetical protein